MIFCCAFLELGGGGWVVKNCTSNLYTDLKLLKKDILGRGDRGGGKSRNASKMGRKSTRGGKRVGDRVSKLEGTV